jgi:hypothetical protein
MGLRVALYTPDETSDDAASGIVGLIVVLARRNAMTPDTLKATPIPAIASATPMRASAGVSQDGVNRETPHMTIATSAATGGIFSSRVLKFTLIGPNDEVERRGVALQMSEGSLSEPSVHSFAHRRRGPAIARTDC